MGTVGVVHQPCFINFSIIFIRKYNLVGLDIYLADFSFFGHGYESSVINLFDLLFRHIGNQEGVDQHNDHKHDKVVVGHVFPWFLYFMHFEAS